MRFVEHVDAVLASRDVFEHVRGAYRCDRPILDWPGEILCTAPPLGGAVHRIQVDPSLIRDTPTTDLDSHQKAGVTRPVPEIFCMPLVYRPKV